MPTPKIFNTTPTAILPCSLVRNALIRCNDVEQIAWAALADLIAHDESLEKFTSYVRHLLAEGNDKEYAKAKSRCGAFIPAAQFSGGRKREHITALTGVAMVDFDHVPDERMEPTLDLLRHDPHALMVYTTTSGHGIRVLYPYTSQQPQLAYIDAWRWGNEYFSMVADLPHDEATKDPTRLSFLCHDARCHYNAQAVPFEVVSNDDARDELLSVAAQCPDADACAELAHRIADRHIPYAEGNRHRNLTYRAFLMNKMGTTEADIAAALAPDAPRGHKEAADLAHWVAAKGTADFGTWTAHTPASHKHARQPMAQAAAEVDEPSARTKTATPEQIRDYLMRSERLRYNTFSATVELWSEEQQAFVDINDRTANSLWHECNTALGRYVRPQDFEKEVHSDAVPAFDPFRTYFDALPPWDGEDYIGHLAERVKVVGEPATSAQPSANRQLEIDYATTKQLSDTTTKQLSDSTTNQPLFDFCFRKWLVAMVASWLDPTVLNQTILTFIGGQGIYKSTFFRRLLPPELNRYFLAKGNSTYVTKDDKLAVSGYALIDFEEIDSMKDSDLNAVKALVTTEVIAERAAYARNRENRPHMASFCATGNNRTFLTDLTGNRRWLPFEVESIASPYDNPVPYEQLYAQCLALIKGGFQHWFSREEDLALEAHKSRFIEPCLEEEQLLRYYRKPERTELGTFLTTTEIVARCSADLRGMLSAKKMGQALKRLGYKQHTIKGKRGYVVVERTYEEINLAQREEAADARRN